MPKKKRVSKSSAAKKSTPKKRKAAGARTKTTVGIDDRELTIHYIKSSQHRTIHIDGIFGSPSPHGGINVSLFNTRFPIPLERIHRINPDGTVDERHVSEKARDGIVREVEISAVMNPTTAEKIGKWLVQTAKDAKKLHRKES